MAVLLLTLCACAGSGRTDPDDALGIYVAESAKFLGLKRDIKRVFDFPVMMELKANNEAVFTFDGKEYDLTWSIQKDNTFRAEGGDIKLKGGVSEGVMVLDNMMDSGAYVILRRGTEIPGTPAPAKTFDWWSGDWYGWWQMTNCTGAYEGWQPDRKDALCHVTKTASGLLNVTVWDEETPRENDLAEFDMTVADDGSENGAVTSGRGYFMNQNLKPGELTVTDQCQYADTMLIKGSYSIPNGSFDFVFMLRPWGASWDDAAEEDMPGHYGDWYLPLIERGARIPAVFDLGDAE